MHVANDSIGWATILKGLYESGQRSLYAMCECVYKELITREEFETIVTGQNFITALTTLYGAGTITEARLRQYVAAGTITAEEFTTITGLTY